MRPAIRRLSWIGLAAAIGYGVGWLGERSRHVIPQSENYPFLAESVPLPHHVPEHPGGISFRFAMAHDVIHERFPRHGPSHYRERERLTRAKLATLAPDDPASFPLADDLSAGLERLGRSDEAVVVIREKLARQVARGVSGRGLYTSHANLGTFLIHANFRGAMTRDLGALARFREGVESIRRSVEVNPEAHFGRERWQAAIAEFLLAAIDDPSLLGRFDCLGNRLDAGIEALLDREGNWTDSGYGRPTDAAFSQGKAAWALPAFFRLDAPIEDPSHWPEFRPVRAHITKVGAERGWEVVPVPSHRTPAPFDEPTLGIIGMWRQGGGANPHFALALGETMLRAGQRFVAWAAFERAARMAERFWPDPARQVDFRDHCRRRQGQIEGTLAHRRADDARSTPWQEVSPAPAGITGAELRALFDKELALGEAYQHAYREYEAARIAAGTSITDDHFFDEFHSGRGTIASLTGPEEWFVEVPHARIGAYASRAARARGVFIAGLAAIVAAGLQWGMAGWIRRRRRVEEAGFSPGPVGVSPPDGSDPGRGPG